MWARLPPSRASGTSTGAPTAGVPAGSSTGLLLVGSSGTDRPLCDPRLRETTSADPSRGASGRPGGRLCAVRARVVERALLTGRATAPVRHRFPVRVIATLPRRGRDPRGDGAGEGEGVAHPAPLRPRPPRLPRVRGGGRRRPGGRSAAGVQDAPGPGGRRPDRGRRPGRGDAGPQGAGRRGRWPQG